MAKHTIRKVKQGTGFLTPYRDYMVELVEYKNGRMDLKLEDGTRINHVEGTYTSEFSGYSYTVKKLLSKPLSRKHL